MMMAWAQFISELLGGVPEEPFSHFLGEKHVQNCVHPALTRVSNHLHTRRKPISEIDNGLYNFPVYP